MNAPGLTSQEARARLERDGPNVLERTAAGGWLALLAGIAREPMFVLLLAAAGIYLAIGEPAEGLLLGAFAVITVLLVVVQQRRGDKALAALRALAAPTARVLRDGAIVRIAAAEVVTGDCVALAEGDRVPADALLEDAAALACDESLLTGESHAVPKAAGEAVFAGTLAVNGHGRARVTATGARTRMGAIGVALERIDTVRTPLQETLARTTWRIALLAFTLSAVLALWRGALHGEWVQGLLAGIAFGMAMLPEEIPMVLTAFFALGAWRLAKSGVLARRPAVIEALGAATVLCVDKTGTLTRNRMQLRWVVPAGSVERADPARSDECVGELLRVAALASRADAADPMDRALVEQRPDARAREQVREYPLAAGRPVMAQAWRHVDGTIELAAKGAPEAVAALCGLDEAARAALHAQVRVLAQDGLRVLAVARGRGPFRADASRLEDHALDYVGLVAFEDPLRGSVPAAVAQARRAGIRVVMITGDHAATALAIARQAGIDLRGGALRGDELEALDDAALARAVRDVHVFARVAPLQKLRLVRALQAAGETVAMTGDGVNDAPALKAAHIGIAMGRRGTDVAREAAGLVLLEEDFASIVASVAQGRRIDDNLARAVFYIVAIHVPIAGLAFVPVLLGTPVLMLPAHVVLTEMVIDPLCSFAFEGVPPAAGLMERPPRAREDHAFRWARVRRALAAGALVLAVVLAIWLAALHASLPVAQARTLAILALTAGNLCLAWRLARAPEGAGAASRLALVSVALLAAAAVAAAVFTAPGRDLLQLAAPAGWAALAAVLAGSAAAAAGAAWAAGAAFARGAAGSAGTSASAQVAPDQTPRRARANNGPQDGP